ncbi:hypothetical protein [Bradyrhizobium sp. Leo170]|uniref:hypothetical protein n=1 Tax=Bradyrhizobium sp. Leo170 TaxID=1571199 RepID=UPI0013EE6800|nr:hypothetical protein [Bradyrhizobium sp. Leo170]
MRIRARGRGLDLPFDQFSRLISGRQIGFGPRISDDPPIVHRPWSLARGACPA